MSITTKVVSTIVLPLTFGIVLAVPVHAAAATNCSVKMTGSANTANQSDSRWTVDTNGVATGTLVVTGDDTCKQTVTLAAWQAPNAEKGRPYDQQKLLDSATHTFGVGTHKMSIRTPDCFYQLDMIRGASAVGQNGTPVYPVGSLVGSLHGGTKTCEVTPPPVTPPATPPVTPPATLPNTGVGSNVAVIGIAATVLGTAFQYVRRLRAA